MRARGRLDSHRQNGLFRGFGLCPFRGRVSSRQPPVTRAVRPSSEPENYRPVAASHTTEGEIE
jgi:hypothetical protein